MYSKLRIDQVLNEVIMGLSKGKMLLGDFEVLYEIAKGKETIVELGTSRGFGAMIMSLHGAEVYTIDNYLVFDDEKSTSVLDREDSVEIRFAVARYLSLFGKITQVYGDVLEISKEQFEPETVDLLYIDADHSFRGTKENFFAWFPKVKKGGFILFHDYSNQHPGVKEFVDGISGFNEMDEVVIPTLGQTVIKIFRKKL